MKAIHAAIAVAITVASSGSFAQGKDDASELPPGAVVPFQDLTPDLTATLVGQQPDYGVRRTVAVGERMFTRYSYSVSVGARFHNGFEAGGPGGDHHRVPAMAVMSLSYAFGSLLACVDGTNTHRNGSVHPSCFVDRDHDGRFDRARRSGTIGGNAIEIPAGESYELVPLSIEEINFRYELVYLGRSGGTLRIGYREYSNELARAAFNTELTFDLAAGGETTFRHRDVRVTVHRLDNDGITFTIQPAN